MLKFLDCWSQRGKWEASLKSADIQREIILALSDNARGLDHFQIAASIGQATVRVEPSS